MYHITTIFTLILYSLLFTLLQCADTKDYICRGYKYSLDTPNIYNGEIKLCESGFHFCVNALDCLSYYDYTPEHTYALVESGDNYFVRDDKVVCDKLSIISTLSYEEFGKMLTGEKLGIKTENYIGNLIM